MADFPIKIEPREYQKAIFETAKNYNTLVILPTGLGKTLIALMLSIERLKKYPRKKVLMLAPTKPLIEQHFQTFTSQLPELFADLQLFTGSVQAKKRKQVWQISDIIFSTPQCIANDLQNQLYSLEEVSLLIIDEAHRCIKNYAYTQVVNYYKKQAQNQRILGLTASPGSETEKIKQICQNLDIEKVELRTRYSNDVKPYLQELEFKKIEVPFPEEFIEIRELFKKLYNDKIEKLKNRNLVFGPINKITLLQLQNKLVSQIAMQRNNFNVLIGMSLTAQAIKIAHAVELLETQTLSGLKDYLQNLVKQASQKKSKASQTLVNAPEFKAVLISLNNLLAQKMEHPKIEELKTLIGEEFIENKNTKIIIFAQFRETIVKICKELNSIPDVKAKIFVGQAKKSNILGQTTGLNQKEQKGIIQEFSEGKINLLCATSIGEEGLDIPEVNAVYFYEPIPSAIRAIQRRGRTARLSPGKLIILMTKDTRDIGHHYASRAKERKMHRAIDQIKEELENNKKEKTLKDFM